ncbi:hypothetical protein B1R94_04570 [Mycolicibacterium litorale]|nr:hypothetical protein B1R94_04570 [Mycolicibacterium litorale]
MGTLGRAASLAFVFCALLGAAPLAHASDDILSGTYEVVGPNTILDTWTITTNCGEVSIGCQADIHSPLIDGQATYRGAHTWMMTLKGQVPVCPDKTTTKGAMVYVWNSQTLQGQLTAIQQGICQMTRPGQEQIPFTLKPA